MAAPDSMPVVASTAAAVFMEVAVSTVVSRMRPSVGRMLSVGIVAVDSHTALRRHMPDLPMCRAAFRQPAMCSAMVIVAAGAAVIGTVDTGRVPTIVPAFPGFCRYCRSGTPRSGGAACLTITGTTRITPGAHATMAMLRSSLRPTPQPMTARTRTMPAVRRSFTSTHATVRASNRRRRTGSSVINGPSTKATSTLPNPPVRRGRAARITNAPSRPAWMRAATAHGRTRARKGSGVGAVRYNRLNSGLRTCCASAAEKNFSV